MPSLPSSSVARRAVALAVVGACLSTPALGAGPPADPAQRAFDARPQKPAAPPGPATKALKQALGDQALLSTDPHTGTVRAAGRLDGALTGPSGRDGAAVALDYMRAHGRALGLPEGGPPGLRLDDRVHHGRMEVLTWRQSAGGIPSSDTYLRAAVDADGRLLSLTGAPAAALDPPTLEPDFTAEEALEAVTGEPAPKGRRKGGDPARRTVFAGGAEASLVLYQAAGSTRLAWRVVARIDDAELADATVDAANGTVVRRANRVKFALNAKVFTTSPDAGVQVPADFAPWGTAADKLLGGRVHAFADPTDAVEQTPTPAAPAETAAWNEPLLMGYGCSRCTWQSGVYAQNKDQSATQLYYYVNTFLDHLAQPPIAFTDANGGYGGGDRIVAQAMDGAATGKLNNASFTAYPDGGPGLLEVRLFDADDRLDGANDASLVFHEVAHGLTERLVTDAQGVGALATGQARALGEGTSDFLAMDFLVPPHRDGPGADVRFASYLGDWMRSQPIDAAPGFSYGDYGTIDPDGEPEAHYDGEIWAQTLWQLRSPLRLGVGGTRRILTGALRIAPPEPSFLDLRNAMLIVSDTEAADRIIWDVFASRGMGYFAASDGAEDTDPLTDFVNPYDEGDNRQDATLSGSVTDQDGRPIAGAVITLAGALDGLGPYLGTRTDAAGRYALQGQEGPQPPIAVRATAHGEVEAEGVVLPGTRDFVLARDWSSAHGGARIASFTGPDNTSSGCGPGGLIDDRADVVWGTDRSARSVVVDLGVPIDVDRIDIDPGAGCGDEASASLGTAQVEVAGQAGTFAPLGSQVFGPHHIGNLTPAYEADQQAVRYVRLTALEPQEPGVTSGQSFIDVAELQVVKVPGSPVGPTVQTGEATGVGATSVTLNATVAANGGAAPRVIFEYGTTPAYGVFVEAAGGEAVSAVAEGLEPATRYYFRAVALRDGRRYEGAGATFVTAPAPAPPPKRAVTSKLRGKKLVANRRGRFPVKVRFAGDAAPGKAKIVVKARKKTIAKGRMNVRPGRTGKKTLRLNAAGRKAIKPGRSRKVRVTVKLPGVAKPLAATRKLIRKR